MARAAHGRLCGKTKDLLVSPRHPCADPGRLAGAVRPAEPRGLAEQAPVRGRTIRPGVSFGSCRAPLAYAARASVPGAPRAGRARSKVIGRPTTLGLAARQLLHHLRRRRTAACRRQLADVVDRAARHAGLLQRLQPVGARSAASSRRRSSAAARPCWRRARRSWRSFGSVAHSGWPSTWAQRAHSRSLPGARQSGRSARVEGLVGHDHRCRRCRAASARCRSRGSC